MGQNDGTSWDDAYTDLQSALGSSTCTEIWVAAGIYKPGTTRTDSFTLKDGVAIYGGFAGTETQLAERDPAINITTLSGDIGTLDDRSDNSYHVVKGGGTNNSAVLDGFTITGGNANAYVTLPDSNGGGMYNTNSSPSLANIIFSANLANNGAGIYNDNSSPSLENVIFSGNVASNRGGGIANDDHSSPSLMNVAFDSNSAAGTGGGINNNYFSSPSLTNVTFRDNSSNSAGGGMYSVESSSPSLQNVTFSGNAAYNGAGMVNASNSNSILTNVTFDGNSAVNDGGGLVNWGSNATVTNVTFFNNLASGHGGGIYNYFSNPNLVNLTFTGNSASEGSGIANWFSNPNIRNSILYGDSDGEIANFSGEPTVTYSIVQGGYLGTGNLDADPLLGPLQDNGGFTQTMALSADSPAIDAGDNDNCPSNDQRGEPRPTDGNGDGNAVCDIGAFEAGGVSSDVRVYANLVEDGIRFEYAVPGALVTFSIYDAREGNLLWKDSRTADETGFAVASIWDHRVDLKQGMYIVVSDGTTTKGLLVEPVSLDVFDPSENVLQGTAAPGSSVWVVANNETVFCGREVTARQNGTWTVDFDDDGCEVVEGMWSYAQVMDPEQDTSEAILDFIEGYHDYQLGDVPTGACNVGGWAVDTDDRERDLAIHVFADGSQIAEVIASNPREDLLGACGADGSCAYQVDLWSLITPYEEHQITVQAYDQETDQWFDLNNTPRTLTCRTHDIYTFDPSTGTTRRITNLPDTHEYNPRWSPDGKKIVHDTWSADWSSHAINITDVGTGVSRPLTGGDGGSYPTWSPSGKWIAFDRDNSLFIVQSTGGDSKLVREDAFMATWAPSSQRLAFQQPSDESIRTVDLKGGNETLVVENGNGPAWSPDGEWIAYEKDGDVWKVRVNNNGVRLGDPIQITSSPFWEGRPTWSNNSKTIAFHAGMGQDTDIWTVPAAGGTATWLTGAPVFGDYDPNYSFNGRFIAYSSFSPEGQAVRNWVSAFTYSLPDGYWTEGMHTYHFERAGDENTPDLAFNVQPYARLYDGTVLLRPWSVIGRTGEACNDIDTIHPDEQTQFYVGWGVEGTYSDALAYYQNLGAKVAWDGGAPVDLVRHEIFPYTAPLDWMGYVCTYTAGPPAMDLRVNYGDNWIESFYEAGHAVKVTLTENDGVTIKATADAVTEPKDYWDGGTGFQTIDSTWYDAQGNPMENPPDIRPYDWVFVSVDNGVSAKVQIGDIRGLVDPVTDAITGTLLTPWFPSDAELDIECLPWGASEPTEMRFDRALPDGADPYSCSWVGEWDITAGAPVGIGYVGPDGHWVANVFRNAHIHVYPEQDYVDADEWVEGVKISAWVEGKEQECTVEGIPSYPSDNPWTTYVSMPFPEECDIVVGDTVIASNGTTTVSHIVRNLAITDVDKTANTVSGTADTGERVYAWVHGYGETEKQLAVDNETWLADFNPFDLVEDMCGRSEIRDEIGSTTGVDWCIPRPTIIAHPDQEWVEGWGFHDGSEVELKIFDYQGTLLYQGTAVAAPPDWDPGNLNAFVRFDVDYDLKARDHLWMTDGESTKDLIVSTLMPTGIDPGGQVIYGVADSESEVTIEHNGEIWTVTAGPEGNWSATLPTLSRGSDVLASQSDEDGDMTRIAFHIPNTRFTVWPEQNYLEGYEWPDGAVVSVTVAGKDACSTEATASFPDWDPSNTFFSLNFPEGCAISAGDFITLSSEALSLTHHVQELAINNVNLDANTVIGTAVFDPEQYTLHTWIHGVDGSYMQLSTVNGTWLADFGSHGFDLQPGVGGRVELVDQFSNATAVEWYIPWPPRLVVQITDNWFRAENFAPSTSLSFKIYDGENLLLEGTTPPTDGGGTVTYWVGDLADLVPGNKVIVSDETITREIVLEAFTFDVFNLTTGHLEGTAPGPMEGRRVWVGIGFDNYGWSMDVFADPDGNWAADYGSPITTGYDWVAAMVFDEDGDASELRPEQIIE